MAERPFAPGLPEPDLDFGAIFDYDEDLVVSSCARPILEKLCEEEASEVTAVQLK